MSTEHLRSDAEQRWGTDPANWGTDLVYRPATNGEFLAARNLHDAAVANHKHRMRLRMAELSIAATPDIITEAEQPVTSPLHQVAAPELSAIDLMQLPKQQMQVPELIPVD